MTSAGSYAKATRLAMSVFLAFFAVSFPMYFLVYYLGLLGYVLNEVPVYFPDTLYCISYCISRCITIVLLSSVLMMLSLMVVYNFSSKVISKIIAYAIALITLPLISVVSCVGLWMMLKLHFQLGIVRAISINSGVLIGSVTLSLIPPFCRRRAHVLTGILLPHVRMYKLGIRLFLLKRSYSMLFPVLCATIYLVGMYIYSCFKQSIQVTYTEGFIHRIVCTGTAMGLRLLATELALAKAFRTESMQRKPWFETQKNALYTLVAAAVVSLAFLTSDTPGTPSKMNSVVFVLSVVVRVTMEWTIAIYLLHISGAFDYANVKSKWLWALSNKMYFSASEMCKYVVVSFMVLLPMCLTYYLFETKNRWTTSEISIVISLLRLIFTYFYSLIDATVKILLVGQRLALPQRIVKRVTYTDIAHTYRRAQAGA